MLILFVTDSCSQYAMIIKSQATLNKKLNMIINILTNPETNEDVTKSNLLPDFPLPTTEKFLEFEKELQDRTVRQQFVSVFIYFIIY